MNKTAKVTLVLENDSGETISQQWDFVMELVEITDSRDYNRILGYQSYGRVYGDRDTALAHAYEQAFQHLCDHINFLNHRPLVSAADD